MFASNREIRSNLLQVFFKIGVIQNFANITGKHLFWSLFLMNLLGLGEMIAKYLRTPFSTEHLQRLFLENFLL